jgi:hypothetical protein
LVPPAGRDDRTLARCPREDGLHEPPVQAFAYVCPADGDAAEVRAVASGRRPLHRAQTDIRGQVLYAATADRAQSRCVQVVQHRRPRWQRSAWEWAMSTGALHRRSPLDRGSEHRRG